MATRTLPPGSRTVHRSAEEPSYCIEYAKSGRSKCSECSKAIPHKQMRLGVGPQSAVKWQHWTCVTDRLISKIGSADKLKGLQDLQQKDRDAAQQRFGGVGEAPRKTGVHTLFS